MQSTRLFVRLGRKLSANLKGFSSTTARHCAALQERYVVRSPFPDVRIPDVSVDEYIWSKTERWPGKTALVCAQTGRNYTFAEVSKMTNNLAQALRVKMGLKRGDVIAIMLPNIPEFCVAVLGAIRAGIVITPINPVYTADEVSRQIKDANAKAIVTLSAFYKLVNTATQKLTSSIPVITINHQAEETTPQGAINFKELCEYKGKRINFETISSSDLCFLPYSSGTTGLPKGVLLTHRNIVSNLCQFQCEDLCMNLETTDSFQDAMSAVLPMYHIYGLILIFLNGFSGGCKLVTLPKFTPEGYFNMLLQYKPTLLFAVPPIVLFMNNFDSLKLDHMKHVRFVMSGAAPLGSSDIERFNVKFEGKIRIMQGYGLTEASPLTHSQGTKQDVRPGGSGWPLPNTECRIVSLEDDDTNLGPGQTGHLLIRGPQIMKGYHNNPQATKETIVNGWLKTGDIAHYDDEKQFYVTDRMKELIKVKGFQVAPAELEALLRHHPEIADAAVTSIPHVTNGEAPKAFIVRKSGTSLQSEQVHQYINKQVANFKQLTGGVVFVDTIPKNPAGKILRRELKNL